MGGRWWSECNDHSRTYHGILREDLLWCQLSMALVVRQTYHH